MHPKVLILCTGNSCRSIIAEALVNARFEGIEADSAGVEATGRVNPHAKKLLLSHGVWQERYHSKTLDEVRGNHYDLIVTVCDHAKESCPIFPGSIPKIHIGFEDPDGKGYEAFEETYTEIAQLLLPTIQTILKEKRK